MGISPDYSEIPSVYYLPVEVCEQIFLKLSVKDLKTCAMVCMHWKNISYDNRFCFLKLRDEALPGILNKYVENGTTTLKAHQHWITYNPQADYREMYQAFHIQRYTYNIIDPLKRFKLKRV